MVDISEGGDSQAGIVSIPLSDKAVQKGLCSDQENLLEKNFPVITALPLRTPPMDSTCNGVSYSFSPDGKEITMTVIFQPKTIYGLEGKKVCLHSRYLNHQDPDADVLTSSIIQNGQATFTFENPVLYGKEERYKVKLSSGEKEGYVERFWFSSDNRWPVPLYCDKNLYPDTNGNLAIEGMFTEKEVFPVSEMNNYPYDRPTKFGENVDYVYDLTKLRECCSQ